MYILINNWLFRDLVYLVLSFIHSGSICRRANYINKYVYIYTYFIRDLIQSIYLHIYTYTYTYIYIYIYIYTHIHIYTHTQMYLVLAFIHSGSICRRASSEWFHRPERTFTGFPNMYIYINVYIYMQRPERTFTGFPMYTYIYIYRYICIYIYIYQYVYIYIYIHT
jgi:hypothetical protein